LTPTIRTVCPSEITSSGPSNPKDSVTT
jgi:hypothetical protein